ncbi:MAG: Pr6Pr family membrane protein [Methanobacteriaceae archaeon]
MRDNKTFQLMYRTVYCTLGILGFLMSLGFLQYWSQAEFYIYYTNLSNYLCLAFMIYLLFLTYKDVKNRETSIKSENLPRIKFYLVIMIFVTFAVNNMLIDSCFSPSYWQNFLGVDMHFILPLMFIFDFILFDKKRVLKIYDPFISLIIPIAYALYIFIRSLFIDPKSNSIIYPYFFLDVNQLGYMGVLEWIGILLVVFIAIGYLFYLINYIQKKKVIE